MPLEIYKKVKEEELYTEDRSKTAVWYHLLNSDKKNNSKKINPIREEKRISYSAGSVVRKLFFISAALGIVLLSFYTGEVPIYGTSTMIIVTVILLIVGIAMPYATHVFVINFLFSIIGCIFFEYIAIRGFESWYDTLFILSEVNVFIFLLSIIFSISSFRGLDT